MIHPTSEQIVTLPNVTNIKINKSGTHVAYNVMLPSLKDNNKNSYLFLYNLENNSRFQLTTTGNVMNFDWDMGTELYVLRTTGEKDSKAQIYYYQSAQGEGRKLTDEKMGVNSFCIQDGKVLYVAKEDPEKREKKYGKFFHDEEEKSSNRLFYFNTISLLEYLDCKDKMRVEEGENLKKPILPLKYFIKDWETIENYSFTSDGLIFSTRIRDDLIFMKNTSIFMLQIDLSQSLNLFMEGEDEIQWNEFKLTRADLSDNFHLVDVSADGKSVILSYTLRDNKFHTQFDMSHIPIDILHMSSADILVELEKNCFTKKLDISPANARIVEQGILLSYYWGTRNNLGIINNEYIIFDFGDPFVLQYATNPQGDVVVLLGSSSKLPEIAVLNASEWMYRPAQRYRNFSKDEKSVKYHPLHEDIRVVLYPKYITDFSNMVSDWDFGSLETISWTASDGLEIEGVLRKPSNFDSNKKYPLVFIIHGGPTWLSMELLVDTYDRFYYPSVQFINNDILVVYPNYRGSIGRGQRFMEIYGENMGFGEMDDIHSCIDYLCEKGWIDKDKVGTMGWSQGGYISAFLSTHSKLFSAISVGAGISNWYTYYIANDIRQWTTDYLDGSPQENPEKYKITAPMNNISDATTPTLIQHGELDQRVPLATARELYRALKEKGVLTHLFIYSGMPHSITKPLENLSVLQQNYTWFLHYLKGDDLHFSYKND